MATRGTRRSSRIDHEAMELQKQKLAELERKQIAVLERRRQRALAEAKQRVKSDESKSLTEEEKTIEAFKSSSEFPRRAAELPLKIYPDPDHDCRVPCNESPDPVHDCRVPASQRFSHRTSLLCHHWKMLGVAHNSDQRSSLGVLPQSGIAFIVGLDRISSPQLSETGNRRPNPVPQAKGRCMKPFQADLRSGRCF